MIDPNPYLPLIVGSEWIYEGEDETIVVTVTDKTKLIDGVTCLVVNDVVFDEDDQLIEDTDDWFAQDTDGNVWYCGEISKNYEVYEGDDPEDAELVDIDGSFKVGRAGAKAGILFKANPIIGEDMRQDVALNEAEDVAKTISLTASASSPAVSCINTCLETSDYTPLEPDVYEQKFYLPGVGFILEIDPEGERVELVEFQIGGQ